jgi:release factor glutamine methyltransferase
MNPLSPPAPPMSHVADMLRDAARTLAVCSDSPRLDAEILLAQTLGRSRPQLRIDSDQEVTPACAQRFSDLLAQRLAGAPVAYLTGTREFWSLSLAVTPAVLVPRPETETLVERVLGYLPARNECHVLDLGTGSGAIAIAIASERPHAHVTGTDISAEALAVATRNAEALGLTQIAWRQGSWFDAVGAERFDVVVSNPPYIAASDAALLRLRAEPLLALTPGASGLEAFTTIIAEAASHLREHGLLALEHGATQAAEVAALLERHCFYDIRVVADQSALPRVTLATIRPSP